MVPCFAHDDRLVRHGRHVGAARRARAHHAGDLRDAEGGERRLVVEDAAEMLAIRKYLRVVRQVGPARVHQIDAGQAVLARDLLRAQVLLHRHGVVGAALDGGVVAHDHALPPGDAPHARDEPGAVDIARVEPIGGELRQLQERRSRINEPQHAVARQQLAARGVALLKLLRSAGRGLRTLDGQISHQRPHGTGVGFELVGEGGDRSLDLRHSKFPGAAKPVGSNAASAALHRCALTPARRRLWRGRLGAIALTHDCTLR